MDLFTEVRVVEFRRDVGREAADCVLANGDTIGARRRSSGVVNCWSVRARNQSRRDDGLGEGTEARRDRRRPAEHRLDDEPPKGSYNVGAQSATASPMIRARSAGPTGPRWRMWSPSTELSTPRKVLPVCSMRSGPIITSSTPSAFVA
jgi:hypothetical protein